MKFALNGETRELETPVTVLALLEKLDLLRARVAVAINDSVVPKSRFERVRIRSGDRVEIIHAVGGG